MPRRGERQAGARADALTELEQLYAQLPELACRGLCGQACSTHVDASNLERDRIAQAGVDLDAPTVDGSCPALARVFGGAGHCTVHQVRPLVCRLWGAAASMPCLMVADLPADRSRRPDAALDGGIARHRRPPHAGLREILERCLHDPTSAALMGRFLRGDRSILDQLHDRLTTIQ